MFVEAGFDNPAASGLMWLSVPVKSGFMISHLRVQPTQTKYRWSGGTKYIGPGGNAARSSLGWEVVCAIPLSLIHGK